MSDHANEVVTEKDISTKEFLAKVEVVKNTIVLKDLH